MKFFRVSKSVKPPEKPGLDDIWFSFDSGKAYQYEIWGTWVLRADLTEDDFEDGVPFIPEEGSPEQVASKDYSHPEEKFSDFMGNLKF